MGAQRFDFPEDLDAWRALLIDFVEESGGASAHGEQDAPVAPSLRVAISSEPGIPFFAVANLGDALRVTDEWPWRLELMNYDGEAIPLADHEPHYELFDYEHSDEFVPAIMVFVSSTEPRRVEYQIGPREKVTGLANFLKDFEVLRPHAPFGMVSIVVRGGVRYGEVIALIDAIRRTQDSPPGFRMSAWEE